MQDNPVVAAALTRLARRSDRAAMRLSQRDVCYPARHEMPGPMATIVFCRNRYPAFHAGLGNKTCLWHYVQPALSQARDDNI